MTKYLKYVGIVLLFLLLNTCTTKTTKSKDIVIYDNLIYTDDKGIIRDAYISITDNKAEIILYNSVHLWYIESFDESINRYKFNQPIPRYNTKPSTDGSLLVIEFHIIYQYGDNEIIFFDEK